MLKAAVLVFHGGGIIRAIIAKSAAKAGMKPV